VAAQADLAWNVYERSVLLSNATIKIPQKSRPTFLCCNSNEEFTLSDPQGCIRLRTESGQEREFWIRALEAGGAMCVPGA